MALRTEREFDRFWSKVRPDPHTGCWEWTASRAKFGYGQFQLRGKPHGAHRLALASVADFDPTLHVRHACDNPSCCNPAHLVPGTHQDNMADMASRGRSLARTANKRAKLTEIAVHDIRAMFASGRWSCVELGSLFGVSNAAIGLIVRNVHWREKC